MGYKMKGSPMKRNFGISPVKHTKSTKALAKGQKTHMELYGKDHTNEDHPDYWKGGGRKETEKPKT